MSDVDNEEAMHIQKEGIYGKYLYLLLNLILNVKLYRTVLKKCNFYMNVDTYIIQISQNVEIPQMSLNRWINKIW